MNKRHHVAINPKLYQQFVVSYFIVTFSMTGVGGRPEVVIEGSDSIDGPWKVSGVMNNIPQYPAPLSYHILLPSPGEHFCHFFRSLPCGNLTEI